MGKEGQESPPALRTGVILAWDPGSQAWLQGDKPGLSPAAVKAAGDVEEINALVSAIQEVWETSSPEILQPGSGGSSSLPTLRGREVI